MNGFGVLLQGSPGSGLYQGAFDPVWAVLDTLIELNRYHSRLKEVSLCGAVKRG